MTAPTETTLKDQIRELVGTVAVQREELQQRRALIASKREAFEATIEQESAAAKALAVTLDANEETLRLLAVTHYQQSDDAKPAPGVTIAITKRVDIDAAAGLEWAKAHEMFLIPAQLDVKAVEKVAKVSPLPFATVTDIPQARIATDLTKAIGGAMV